MKLNIGQNIRTLRRAADMTQEELADKLGVTYQSVSRWENGGTYPDMELLPAIADIFSVTVDHLLEHDKSAMEKHFNDLCARFKTAVAERNHGTVVEILRELRRDLRRYTDVLRLQDISIEIRKYRNEAPPEVIEEFRQYLEAVTLVIPEERGWTIRALAVIEDDEHLEEFLTKNSSHVDLTTDALLKERYQWRREEEDAAYMNQMNLYTMLSRFIRRGEVWHDNYSDTAAWMSGPSLAYLHALHNVTPDPDHPVSGNGELDLWARHRIELGFDYAAHLVSTGKTDEAFTVLNDTISLLEKLAAIPIMVNVRDPRTVLESTSPLFTAFSMEAHSGFCRGPEKDSFERSVEMSFGKTTPKWSIPTYPSRFLGRLKTWTAFDPIRSDPRFAECLAHMETFAGPVSEEQMRNEWEAAMARRKEEQNS